MAFVTNVSDPALTNQLDPHKCLREDKQVMCSKNMAANPPQVMPQGRQNGHLLQECDTCVPQQ